MFRMCCVLVFSLAAAATVSAQTPQPFPRPGTQQKPVQPNPNDPRTTAPRPPAAAQRVPAPGEPDEAMLGAPLYPSAVFLTSYDAGRGQRFYLFGVNAPYGDMVNYYRTILKDRGDQLFESPPTHFFEIARFRDDSMAFAPSVTIKDYTFGGSAGYPNPKRGDSPERFPTVIQIVPAPR